ncbi:MAG: trigger factor [Novosphingobium sp.]
MQIVETSTEGLKRGYSVTIPAQDIASKVEGEVRKIAPQIKMPGFRPGKVPANLVRKMHGATLHQEALNTSIREAIEQLVREHKLRPAMQPDVQLGEGYAEGDDAQLTVALEVLPDVPAPQIEGLQLEKLVVPVAEAQVDESLARIGAGQKSFVDGEDGRQAQDGDQLIVDFAGKVDGEAFDGGSAEDQPLELGAGRFIPGFEEPLVGAVAGETRTVEVTFPEDYPAKHLAGKAASFEVTVKAVKVPTELVYDDDFAKSLGLEGIDQLKGLLRGQLEQEIAGLTRTQMKRALLDKLAAGHDFEVPPSMVEAEFQQIWSQLEQEAAGEADPEAAKAEIERDRDDYRGIAERRVRLGLLLSEIGQANGVQVTQQEMEMLIRQAAQQYRESDRERFIQFVRSDAMAAAQLRAPLYEDKVVDFLFDKAEVSEREVTREELEAAIEAEDKDVPGHVHGPGCDHDHDHHHDGHGHDAEPAAAGESQAQDTEALVEEPAAAEPAAEAKPKKPRKPKAESADDSAGAATAEGDAAEPAAKKPSKRAAKA